jgi:trigger factor
MNHLKGGTAENYPLQLGSGMFIPGFEDQVIGMTPG